MGDEVEDLAPIESDVPKITDTVQSSGTVCTNEDTANTVSLELNDSDLLGDTKMADIDRNLSAEDLETSSLAEEEEEYKPRWEINYDALYEAQDDFHDAIDDPTATEEQLPTDAQSALQSVDTMETDCTKSEPDEDTQEYKPRWEINYDALYAAQDDLDEYNDDHITTESSQEETSTNLHQNDSVVESDIEDVKNMAVIGSGSDQHSTATSDTEDTEVENIRDVIHKKTSEAKGRESSSSCNEEDIATPTYIPSSPPNEQIVTEPNSNIPSNLDSKSRSMKRYGRRDTETINSAQKQKTDLLLESVQEEEEISPQDSSNDEKDENVYLRRSRESSAPERDILFSELKNMSSGELSPIVEDMDEEDATSKNNDLSKLKTLIPGIAEIRSPGIMSPPPGCGSSSQERTSWGEWMEKFIPSYGENKPEDAEFDGDDQEDDKYERDSEISELDSVYSEFDSEYASDDDDVIEYESYQEIEDNLFVMQAVKQQRPWADVDERDVLKVLRGANGNKQETILQLIELDKERCKLLGLE